MNVKKSTIFMLSFIAVVSSNLQARYKEIPLEHLKLQSNLTTQQDVAWDYKIFNKKDCKKYLKSGNILRKGHQPKGYQPIQITVKNNTSHDIIISPQDFTLTHVPALQVAEKLHRNNLARGLGFATPAVIIGAPVAALSVYAGAMAAATSSASGAVLFGLCLPAFVVMSPFVITAIVQGTGAQDFNDTIDNILSNKELRKQTLVPEQTVSGIIYIPQTDFKKSIFAKANPHNLIAHA